MPPVPGRLHDPSEFRIGLTLRRKASTPPAPAKSTTSKFPHPIQRYSRFTHSSSRLPFESPKIPRRVIKAKASRKTPRISHRKRPKWVSKRAKRSTQSEKRAGLGRSFGGVGAGLREVEDGILIQLHAQAKTLAGGIHLEDPHLHALTGRKDIFDRMVGRQWDFRGMDQSFKPLFEAGKSAVGYQGRHNCRHNRC